MLKTLPFRGNRIKYTLQVKISNPTQYWRYIPQKKKNGQADDFFVTFCSGFCERLLQSLFIFPNRLFEKSQHLVIRNDTI